MRDRDELFDVPASPHDRKDVVVASLITAAGLALILVSGVLVVLGGA